MNAKVLSFVLLIFRNRDFSMGYERFKEKNSPPPPRAPVMWETHTFTLFFTPPASPAIAG
jgi:hypothetical protein